MKRALVTGSAGFVGRGVVRHLEVQGDWDIVLCDIRDKNPSRRLDCRDYFSNFSTRWSQPFDLFVHTAAVIPSIEERTRNPLAVTDNYGIDSAAAQWVARTKPAHTVWFSSCAAYPADLPHEPFEEPQLNVDRWVDFPAGEYGWTKVIGERHAIALQQLGHKVHLFRPFSGYGTDQSLDYPFPSIIERAVRREDPFTIWGDGSTVRDFIHTDDIVAAIFAAIDADVIGPVNLCTGRGTSMVGLTQLAVNAVNGRHPFCPTFEFQIDKPAGTPYRVGDPTLMSTFYKTKVSLEEGVWRAVKGEL